MFSDSIVDGLAWVELTHYRGMQECFKKYPEVYSAELADDEEPESSAEGVAHPRNESSDRPPSTQEDKPSSNVGEKESQSVRSTDKEVVVTHPGEDAAPVAMPSKFSDATDANNEAE